MNLFYHPDIEGNCINFTEEQSKHCIRVLRLGINDEIFVTDGIGNLYKANITSEHPKHCVAEIIEKYENYGKRDYYVHIAIAPTKNIDRYEWFLEKATEIGIDEITPIISYHSERKVIKNERLEKVIISAMKQSLKAYKPKLNRLQRFEKFIKNCNFEGKKMIAHCNNEISLLLKNAIVKTERVLIMIGPEGDFSPQEVQLAKQQGFTEISLGKSRLRTETAGIVAVNTVSIINQ